ncbi:helix-turn-helix domain-containing protein [Virgibacillus phage Mimir87]|nr:helix-turn-helix domain-containing protein [Virgibacillus phage Mimir87]
MYKNLEGEMARKGITKAYMAKKFNMRYPTLVDKLNGKYRLYFDEAIQIKDEFFPEYNLDYLFATEKEEDKKSCPCHTT